MVETNTTFACDMSSLTEDERNKHIATMKEVFGTVNEIRELDEGYAFRLPNDETFLIKAVEFIAGERLCCPFFTFEIKTGPDEEFWLSLKGADGIKPFIQAEIGQALNNAVARKAGFIN